MQNDRPAPAHGKTLAIDYARRIAASSLILFLVGDFAQRTWVLLNSDVGQLIRRLH